MPSEYLPRRQAILVLGMHRSGTSALSGVLARLGIETPKTLMQPANDNPLGFWESKEIVAFHERLLASIGSAWSDWSQIDPASLETDAAREQIALLPSLIEQEFGAARFFFVKDPRMCRFPGIWLRALAEQGIQASAVIPLRNPTEVACSLEARNQLGVVRSRLIWLRHVLDAEHATRAIPRAVVSYETLLASWPTEVERIAEDLALQWPVAPTSARSQIDEFLHAELRHFSKGIDVEAATRLDTWVRDSYSILKALAQEERGGSLQRLDEIRNEFNLAASAFAPVLREAESAQVEAVARLRGQLKAASASSAPSAADLLAGFEKKLAGFESRMTAAHKAEITQLAESTKMEQAAFRSEIVKLAAWMRSAQEEQRADVARLAESTRRGAEQHGAALLAFADEMRSRRQGAEDLESKVRAQGNELATLRRRFEQSKELFRQESARAKAVNVELKRIVADQRSAIKASAEKIRLGQAELGSLRQKLDGLGLAHAKDLAVLQGQLQWQRDRTERMADELNRLHGSKGWKILNLIRIALGRRVEDRQDELSTEIELIGRSGLFDRQWYLDQYPEVAKSGADPVEHYLRFGAAELRNPSLKFDTRSYLDRYPDVKEAGFNPLVHYIQFGMREGRSCGSDNAS